MLWGKQNKTTQLQWSSTQESKKRLWQRSVFCLWLVFYPPGLDWTGLTECSDSGDLFLLSPLPPAKCAYVCVSVVDVVWTWRNPYFSQPSLKGWFCPLCIFHNLFVFSCTEFRLWQVFCPLRKGHVVGKIKEMKSITGQQARGTIRVLLSPVHESLRKKRRKLLWMSQIKLTNSTTN